MRNEPDGARSDAEYIRRSLGEPGQFSPIFERHAASVHRYLLRAAGRSDVEDLLSEVFVIAFRSRHRYDAAFPDARPWLFGIATNVLRHHRRSAARRHSLLARAKKDLFRDEAAAVDEQDQLVSQLGADKETAVVRDALSQLEPSYRDVLLLWAGPRLSYEEIAAALGVPVGTVRSRLHRGKEKLRELLEVSGQYRPAAETRTESPQ
jgi:RNA polymerase sigma factor (sigma-70 family)